jgi:ZIP family zinc transporter
MPSNFIAALLLSLLAGLATSLGALLGVLGRAPGRKTLAVSMGFSAGVMLVVAFACMLVEAQDVLGQGWGFIAFITGMAGMWALDIAVPHEYFAERYLAPEGRRAGGAGGRPPHGRPLVPGKEQVFRAGLLVAAGITIHNFPEGIAVFSGGLHDIGLGWALAGAVMLHNIPEGLAVAVPVYGATGSRLRGFWWGTLSGLAEPVGALLAGLLLYHFLSPAVVAWTLAAAAGLMVFISLDELLPAAQAEGEGHLALAGVIAGMAVIAAGLWFMGAVGAGHPLGSR